MKLEIIYEDNSILAVNKPTGITVNKSRTASDETLQELVEGYISKDLKMSNDEEFKNRGGMVHRLDKETSGVILFAKTEKAFHDLQRQFKERQVEKEYLALVFGEVEEERIEIDAPLGRSPAARTKIAVVKDGRESKTEIEKVKMVRSENFKYTLVKAFPKTGRTHQIRVHLAAINHPVVGDILYAGKRRGVVSQGRFGRLMLHAHKITFKNPETGEQITVVSEAPQDFAL